MTEDNSESREGRINRRMILQYSAGLAGSTAFIPLSRGDPGGTSGNSAKISDPVPDLKVVNNSDTAGETVVKFKKVAGNNSDDAVGGTRLNTRGIHSHRRSPENVPDDQLKEAIERVDEIDIPYHGQVLVEATYRGNTATTPVNIWENRGASAPTQVSIRIQDDGSIRASTTIRCD